MICAAPVRSFPGRAVLCFRSQGGLGAVAIIHPAVSHRRHAALFPRSRRCQQTSPPQSAHSPAVGLRAHPCRSSRRNISPFPQSSSQASAWPFLQSGNPLGHSRSSVPALPLPEERTVGTDLLFRIIQSMTLPGRGAVCCPGGHLLGDDRERARRGRAGKGRAGKGRVGQVCMYRETGGAGWRLRRGRGCHVRSCSWECRGFRVSPVSGEVL